MPTSKVCTVQIRHQRPFPASTLCWKTVPLSRRTRWESNFTLSTFFIPLNDLLFYRIFHSQLCAVFNLHHSKDEGQLSVWGCELLLNCKRSESCFRGVTCVGAQTALDTEGAVNSPDSASLVSVSLEDQLWSPRCGMSKSPCVTIAFLKLLETWKKKKIVVAVSEFHVAIQAKTTRGSTSKRHTGVQRGRYWPPLWCFVGLHGGTFMHHDTMANTETWLESAFLKAEKPV